ncbi:hypothetical protein [Rickettsiales endosymbiont of Trichoplax sp. H2]|uniref:hypothetical protein n=1 Tax=Rickettsiales endosymbiont of Trichoplax sp. H2 TaxID=2021221 RepID=UPI0012B38765|nr:hypothetical protein [Rickettsiales endosymbiont of Trichoplax sp. H2]MSO14238.1 hypothetical protein [Rickettsiales endosymbiont of Trichoplax sp. H2]
MGIREIIKLYPLPRDYFEEATLDREEALRLLSLLDDPEDIERVLTLYKEAISKLNSIAEYRLARNFCLEAGYLLEEFKKENAIICCKDEVYHHDDCVSIPGDISHMYSFSKLLGGQYERSPIRDDLCSNDLGNLREWNEELCCISKRSSISGVNTFANVYGV